MIKKKIIKIIKFNKNLKKKKLEKKLKYFKFVSTRQAEHAVNQEK